MADLQNATPFGARIMPSADRDGRDLLLIVVAAQFDLPNPRDRGATTLQPSETQAAPPLADEYVGEPGQSSLRQEGQIVYTRPATDICILGHACAPDAKAVRRMNVEIHVGPCSIQLQVHGDRVWERAMVGALPSQAERFVRIPLIWERAYGGVATGSSEKRPAFEPRNPIGCGFETNPAEAVGKPLPNIEDPADPIVGLSDRPRPMGVTPLARHWQPRVGYAGTYDEAWRRHRAPFWPKDFDERFFCAAPSQLQARPHMKGGERVVLDGLHPEGAIEFRLPHLSFVARSSFVDRTVRTMPMLDAITIDTDALRLRLFFRSFVPAPLRLIKHRETLLRALEPWETVGAR
jgi:hypothetical protein